jgi:polyisoprenoid-binding protein YceI
MKATLLLLPLWLSYSSAAAAADVFIVDKSHSEVGFRVRHLMSKVPGRFTDFEGEITADAEKPEQSSVRFVIRSKSVDTANSKRDEHLRSEDFFDAARFPTVTFESRAVRRAGENRFDVVGDFTLHGVKKEITLPVAFLGIVKDPWGVERAGFEISTHLNRKDFGIVWNQTLDTGGLLLGEDVEISINIEATKRQPVDAP